MLKLNLKMYCNLMPVVYSWIRSNNDRFDYAIINLSSHNFCAVPYIPYVKYLFFFCRHFSIPCKITT